MIANTFARFVAERRALSAAVATALVAACLTAAFATPAPRSTRRADAPTPTATPVVTATPAPRRGQPQCFGAASRDPDQPCRNPRLRLMVVPTPRRARTLENPACDRIGSMDGKKICAFGVDAAQATDTVALVGDSHAGMWRLVLEGVAQANRWHGIHLGHASCPLSKAVRDIVEPKRSHCALWKRHVFSWFRRHPQVHTLFVSELTGGSGVVPTRGRTEIETAVAGYLAAWKALPATVGHIVVIRDTPKSPSATSACITRAIARHRPAGTACAVPRSRAFDPDPSVLAARRLRSPRVQVVDLSDVFCGRRRCYPVIGGSLVYRDTTHMMPGFAMTLRPVLVRRMQSVTRSW